MRVRHSTFHECTGTAIRETVNRTILGEEYPAVEVEWDKNYWLDRVMSNYNLIFIVPANTRHV